MIFKFIAHVYRFLVCFFLNTKILKKFSIYGQYTTYLEEKIMNEEIYSCIQMSCEKKIMTFSIKRFFFPYFFTIATPFLSEFKEEERRILLRKFLTTFYCCVYWQLAHTSTSKKNFPISPNFRDQTNISNILLVLLYISETKYFLPKKCTI